MPVPPSMVVNSSGLEASILGIISPDILDQADMARIWKAFTTIKKTPFDPYAQARRLENFWWRVWGSKQSRLLPANDLGILLHKITNELHLTVAHRPQRSHTFTTATDDNMIPAGNLGDGSNVIVSAPSIKTKLTPIAPHPILKKSKGASNSVPRPTARFISPHETEDKTLKLELKTTPQPSSLVTLHDLSSDKKSASGLALHKKKGSFVILAKKKRPVIIRRPSSHSSTDVAGRVHEFTRAGTVVRSYSERLPSIPAVLHTHHEASDSPSLDRSPVFSDETCQSDEAIEKSNSSSSHITSGSQWSSNMPKGNGKKVPRVANKVLDSKKQSHSCSVNGPAETDGVSKSKLLEPPPIFTTSNHPLLQTYRENQAVKSYSKSSIKGKQPVYDSGFTHMPLAEPSSIVATRIFASGKVYPQSASASSTVDNREEMTRRSDKGKLLNMKCQPGTGNFAKSTQTAQLPPPGLSDNLSRSKSQLTLLLEKDRARNR